MRQGKRARGRIWKQQDNLGALINRLPDGRLAANLIQAQRDYFGAHGRNDAEGGFHTEVEKINKNINIVRTKDPADLRTCARFMAGTEPWLTLGRDYKACLRAVNAPLREVYAAKENGRAVGFIVLQMTGTFRGYIQTVCVGPEARGRGIGTLLMSFAEKRIFAESPNVFMCVSSFNKGAARLYKKLGYRKTGVLKDFVARGHDELLLRKTLGPLGDFKKRQ